MPYEPVAHGRLEGLNYRAPRPFIIWRRPDLLKKIEEWVAFEPAEARTRRAHSPTKS